MVLSYVLSRHLQEVSKLFRHLLCCNLIDQNVTTMVQTRIHTRCHTHTHTPLTSGVLTSFTWRQLYLNGSRLLGFWRFVLRVNVLITISRCGSLSLSSLIARGRSLGRSKGWSSHWNFIQTRLCVHIMCTLYYTMHVCVAVAGRNINTMFF